MRVSEWTNGQRESPEPYEGNVVATILIGTVAWGVLFVVQLPFYGWYRDHGHEWWLWCCLTATGGGLLALWYVRRREAALRAARGARGEPAAGEGPSSSADREASGS